MARSPPDELLAVAIQSRDPVVLWNVGELQQLLNPTAAADANRINRVAWDLVACRRGFDCGATASWVENTCSIDPRCPGGSGEEILRYWAGDDLAAAEQQAIEISDKLDAGDWQGLGFAVP